MNTSKTLTIRLSLQRQRTASVTLPLNGSGVTDDGIQVSVTETTRPACRMGTLSLRIPAQEVHTSSSCYLDKEDPIQISLPMQQPRRMTALYLFNDWWTRPAFVERFADIPSRTQVLLLDYAERFCCFVPMVGQHFKTTLTAGTDDALTLVLNAGLGGQSAVQEPIYLMAEADTLQDALRTVFCTLAEHHGIRLREERRLPEMFRYLGWCSWDAFYADVTEDKMRQKAEELANKKIPVRWLLVDDGWLTVSDKRLAAFQPDSVKFPKGFRSMTEEIKASTMVDWIGVWHALGGYWCGVAPESPLAQQEQAHLMTTVGGTVVPSPVSGGVFYRNWYELLRREGIDFVKVDGQSSAACYFENTVSIGASARGIQQALEDGASRMDGAVINCMGMAMENLLSRPATALSRNSDDFVPARKDGFGEHLLQNAYNALYHNLVYCCDWDMFWTQHPDGVKHGLLRAVSGGPVYFSDRIGDSDGTVLKPLTYLDGRLLMMQRSAMPTADCVFVDPRREGVLKLHNVAPWGSRTGGGIAAYNLSGATQTCSFTPAEIPELTKAERYLVYDWFGKTVRTIDRDQRYELTLEAEGFGWYVVLPRWNKGTCLGRMDKYAGFLAVEQLMETENTTAAVLHEAGPLGWVAQTMPRQVLVNGVAVTAQVRQAGELFTLDLPEAKEQVVLQIEW